MNVMTAPGHSRLLFAAAVLGALASPVAPAAAGMCFESSKSIQVRADEVREGDTYFAGANVDIAGTLDGDLIGFLQVAVITGTVDGDVIAMGSSLDIQGAVNDTVRFWGNSLTVSGTVDGDVLGFGNVINIHPRGRVTGSVYAFGSTLSLDGRVDGPVRFTGGKVTIGGTIGGDVRIEADTIQFEPGARIEGDFSYESRKPVEADLGSIVAGEVEYTEPKKDRDEPEPFLTLGGVLWWSFWTLGTLLVGLVAVAVLRRPAATAIVRPLRDEPVLGLLIGLGAFLVTLAAALLALLLVVTIPLGLLTLILFAAAVYLAKIPVALWLGSLVLRPVVARGGDGASPYLTVTVGVVLVHVAFAIPYIGWLMWLATVFAGLGAGILAVRARSAPSESPPPAA